MEAAERVDMPSPRGKKQQGIAERPYALIKCSARRDPSEPLAVDIGLNGRFYRLQRGEFVPIPAPVVEVLENAEIPYYVEEVLSDGSMGRKVYAGMQKRYPFEVVARLSEEQYLELREIALQRKITKDDIVEYR